MILLTGCLTSCDKRGQNIRGYYLPLEQLKGGVLYVYSSGENDSIPPYALYYDFLSEKNQLKAVSYDFQFNKTYSLVEDVVSNGILLDAMQIYDQSENITDSVEVKIHHGNTFPYIIKDTTSLFIYRIEWEDPLKDGIRYELTKNRKFMGFEEYTLDGHPVSCVRFDFVEQLDYYEEGYTEIRSSGFELYAKDIGMVYYEKEISGGLVINYKLTKRIKRVDFSRKGIPSNIGLD